jgi:hypothetical protein
MGKKRRPKKPPSAKEKKLNDLAWKMARVMTRRKFNDALCNKHVYCKVCQREFCLGFDGVDVYCETCYYKPYTIDGEHCGCVKACIGGRICQSCGGSIC